MIDEIKRVITPVMNTETLEELKAGDVFYITGILVTARDEAHKRAIEENVQLPVDLSGLVVFHAGPIMKRTLDGWECISIGPTTSRRMEKYEDLFIERTGVKIIVGKGGMGHRTAEACRKNKSIYAIFPGGCGVLGASRVVKVRGVEWLDLGMPEALWILEVRDFGPLIVTIDTKGENLSDKLINSVNAIKENLEKDIVSRLVRLFPI
ncbi:MAG: FumA C-terminus/TtdB family hydratase beta subunit [Desulfurococcaceae archaeon]